MPHICMDINMACVVLTYLGMQVSSTEQRARISKNSTTQESYWRQQLHVLTARKCSACVALDMLH
jgi:hypothetical protein